MFPATRYRDNFTQGGTYRLCIHEELLRKNLEKVVNDELKSLKGNDLDEFQESSSCDGRNCTMYMRIKDFLERKGIKLHELSANLNDNLFKVKCNGAVCLFLPEFMCKAILPSING
jgi:hypothetical protein